MHTSFKTLSQVAMIDDISADSVQRLLDIYHNLSAMPSYVVPNLHWSKPR